MITKEILQDKQDSIYREVGIKKDAKEHFFYFTVNNTADPTKIIGTDFEIPITHITREIDVRPNKMVTISLYSAFIIYGQASTGFPIYIRFPGLEIATRYHFMVGPGYNNFNNSNIITLPCGDLPKGRIYFQIGDRVWNQTEGQQDMAQLADLGPSINIAYADIKFKVQTISLE